MPHPFASRRALRVAVRVSIALLAVIPIEARAQEGPDARAQMIHSDPVLARVYEHGGRAHRPLVVVVDRGNLEPHVWERVKNLVAYRLHREQPDGRTVVDAPIYLVRSSHLYQKAAAALRTRSSVHEYLWCLLAAVFTHEGAHTAPGTEREALLAEAEQLRRCLFAGHLQSGEGWSAGAYLLQVEARLRNPRADH